MRIKVDKDWCSSPLWVPSSSGGWASCDYRGFNLPESLVQRLGYYSDWHDSWLPGDRGPEQDWDALSHYEIALAIDLKRHYGESAQIFVHFDGKLHEVTGSMHEMFRVAL